MIVFTCNEIFHSRQILTIKKGESMKIINATLNNQKLYFAEPDDFLELLRPKAEDTPWAVFHLKAEFQTEINPWKKEDHTITEVIDTEFLGIELQDFLQYLDDRIWTFIQIDRFRIASMN